MTAVDPNIMGTWRFEISGRHHRAKNMSNPDYENSKKPELSETPFRVLLWIFGKSVVFIAWCWGDWGIGGFEIEG